MVGYRMLFGVPDEITDVTRVSGMVRKRRLIYRMTSFDYRKVFGVTGNVPGMTNGFREFTGGATHPGEAHRLWGDTPALSGLVGQPQRGLCAKRRKSKEKKKKREEVGREGDSSHQTKSNSVWGVVLPPLARPTPWGSLGPQGKVPLPPPIYMGLLGQI